MKNKYCRATDIIFIATVFSLILAVSVCVHLLPAESFSEEENRALSDAPRFSVARLADGRFFSELSSFYSDRLPLRRGLVRAKATLELMLGRGQNNGVLFLEGGRLCDRCEYAELDTLTSNIEAISSLCEKKDIRCFMIPRSADVYFGGEESERIAQRVYSAVGSRELFYELSRLSGETEDVYYKTDHHLSADGAYALYRSVTASLGVTAFDRSEFLITTVSEDFRGSAYSACGLLPVSQDRVTLYRYALERELSVCCEDVGCELASLYCFEVLEKKDQYRVFLGGNHGVIRITDESADREKLLIIKDSFANAVIPLLARHFDLIVIDPRYADVYFPEDTVATVVIMGIDTVASGRIFK